MTFRQMCPSKLRVVIGLWLAVGCGGVSSERIEQWRAAAESEPLIAAAKAEDVSPALRAQAAAALVEIGLVDRMEAVVAGMPIEQRAQVIPQLVPLLAKIADGPDVNRGGDARDGLYCLREQSTTDDAKKRVDAVLFPALEKDLRADRARVGRRAVKDILVALGVGSIPTLERVLDDANAPFAAATEVLDKVGDTDARGRGGAALVKRARAAQPVPAPLWTAIATLGGKEAVAFLSEKVERGSTEDRDLAAAAMTKLKRDPAALTFALKVAGAPGTSVTVRERMFEVAQNMPGEESRKGLIALVSSAGDPALRYRAYEAALKVGKGEAVLPALEALPPNGPFTPDEVKEKLVRPISSMPGFDSREGVFKAMESKSAVARLVAIRVLEYMGFSDDAEHVGKLSKDKATIKGMPPGFTVGKEATRIVGVLKKNT